MNTMTQEQRTGALAIIAYMHGVSPREWVDDIFHGSHPSYLEEKERIASRSFAAFFGSLDAENQRRMLNVAYGYYLAHNYNWMEA